MNHKGRKDILSSIETAQEAIDHWTKELEKHDSFWGGEAGWILKKWITDVCIPGQESPDFINFTSAEVIDDVVIEDISANYDIHYKGGGVERRRFHYSVQSFVQFIVDNVDRARQEEQKEPS